MWYLKIISHMHIFYKEARKMKYTSNHNFKLPAPSDTINVEVTNY